jgi:hypothetical protein
VPETFLGTLTFLGTFGKKHDAKQKAGAVFLIPSKHRSSRPLAAEDAITFRAGNARAVSGSCPLDARVTRRCVMDMQSNPEDHVAAGVKENVKNLPILSLVVAGLAGAGVMAIFSKLTSSRE